MSIPVHAVILLVVHLGIIHQHIEEDTQQVIEVTGIIIEGQDLDLLAVHHHHDQGLEHHLGSSIIGGWIETGDQIEIEDQIETEDPILGEEEDRLIIGVHDTFLTLLTLSLKGIDEN